MASVGWLKRLALCGMATLLGTLAPACALADEVVAITGQPVVLRGGQSLAAVPGMSIEAGDELVSRDAEELLVRFEDGARLAVRPESRVWIRDLPQRRNSRTSRTLRVSAGRARFVSARHRSQATTAFETPAATIGIRGTDIEIVVQGVATPGGAEGTYLIVNDGVAQLRAADGSQVEVQPGQVAFGARSDLSPRSGPLRTRPAARLLVPAEYPAAAPGALDGQLR